MRAVEGGQVTGELNHAPFGEGVLGGVLHLGIIVDSELRTDHAVDRGDVDDAPLALLEHQLGGMPGHGHEAGRVDFHGIGPLLR